MKRHLRGLVQSCAFALAAGVLLPAVANVANNPYESIVDRNPFGIKPPPPPVEINTPPPLPAPLWTVELTGVTSILSSKRALLEITPGPGKPVVRAILSEGERLETVEVVSIDVIKNEVTVKNGPVTTNLTFKTTKGTATAAAAPPGAAGLPHLAAAAPAPRQAASPHNLAGRNNVLVAGGSPAAGPNAASDGSASADPNSRGIPSRDIRSTSREQQYLMMELNRELNNQTQDPTGKRGSFPLPPTPLNPNPTPQSQLSGLQ
jgi:hypothetical protein